MEGYKLNKTHETKQNKTKQIQKYIYINNNYYYFTFRSVPRSISGLFIKIEKIALR